jgi:predicted transcriptional regulator
MIEPILGSKNKEQVLIFINSRGEAYAREISGFYNTSLTPVQKQLENLEASGILISKPIGRTIMYSFNTRYAFYKELKALLDKVTKFLPEEQRNKLINIRTRPRRRKKPV